MSDIAERLAQDYWNAHGIDEGVGPLVEAMDRVRLETIEECGAMLGAEVLRLLGQRDREDVDGIARAAKLVRELAAAPPTQKPGSR